MASARWRKNAALIEQLQQEPHRFAFFQAVRLLERAARQQTLREKKFAQVPVGQDAPPSREALRFRAQPSLSFRGADIDRIEIIDTVEQQDLEAPQQQWQMLVNLFGLFGSTGVLPFHFSELITQRLRLKDRALLDFLDVLNHRSLSLYFQAWAKYRLPVVYERNHAGETGSLKNDSDIFTHIQSALIGLGTSHLGQRLAVPDVALLGFSAHLARGRPSAPTLARVLRHYFQLPIEVDQFIGLWQGLPEDMQSRLPGPECPRGLNNRIGMNLILGRQCWDVQSKFRVRIDDLDYPEFVDIAPGSEKLAAMKAMIRFFAGTEFDFDIEISIDQRKLPRLGLGQIAVVAGVKIDGAKLMLGWNCLMEAPASVTRKQMIRIRLSE